MWPLSGVCGFSAFVVAQVLVQFSEVNEVVGAEIRTFLLERSRVTSTNSANERAYHIMYQVVVGTPLVGLPVDKVNYLSMSGCTTIDGVDDKKEFDDVSKAMGTVGMSSDDTSNVWQCIAALMLLGNISFGSGDTGKVSDTAVMKKASDMLGIGDVQEMLEKRSITVGGETTKIDLNPQQALLSRDAVVKIVFARMFTFLVNRMNKVTSNREKQKRYIGLLDVYGFEFFDTNSFEQLCINFANEKLQQFFLKTVFTGEEQQYKDEGVPWTPIPYSDNAEIIALIENTTNGIYTTLDSSCRTGNSTGQKFCAALHDAHPKSKVFGAPKVGKKESRSKTDHFVVKHFAGDVVYFCGEFLDKNNDSLNAEFEAALLASSKPIVAEICQPEETGKKQKKGGSFSSVGAKFVKSLKDLMTELQSSQAHFVRCVKPNPELLPQKIHGENTINQLRMSGMLDAVKLIQAGYPTRIPYEDIYTKYKSTMPERVASLEPAQFCEVIAEVCDVGKKDYALGTERMFFRLGCAAFLEELSEADPVAMAPILNEKLALFEKKKEARAVLEKDLKMWVCKRRYKVLVAEKRKKDEEERRKEEERKRREEEARKRKEEEEKRRAAADARRKEEEVERLRKKEEEKKNMEEEMKKEAATASAAGAKKVDKAAVDKAFAAAQAKKEEEAAAAARTLGDVEAMINALEQDADLEQAVQAAGGVTALINMASKHEDSALVQAQFAGVLRDLCISDEIALEIHQAGGVESIIDAARRHFDSIEVQAAVAGALRNLSELDEVAADIASLGGIEMLVDAGARHPDDQTVQARVAGALWGLSVHDEIAELIGEMGGADALITSAKNHPMNGEVQASTAGAMRNLSVSDDNKHSIADMEGLEVLIHAAENHLDSSLVQAQVAGALRNLSLNDEVAEQIAVSGGIEALVNAAAEHRTNSKVQAGVAGALRNLSVNDEIAEEIATAGGIDALITASQEHPGNSDVQAEVAGALWGLSVNDDIEEAIAGANGIKVLVEAAKNHYGNAKVQARVAGALRKLSANDENKHEIAEAGGINMLIHSSKVHLDNAVVQAGVAGAISNLSVDDEIEQQIATQGGIDTLIEASRAHVGNVKVQARVVRALTNLSVHDSNKALIASVKGIVALIGASLEHGDSAEVQAGVAGALRNLSVSPDIAQVIVDNGAIQSLIQAAHLHTTNAIVQAGVAGALRNLSVTEANRKAIIANGGMESLVLASQIHADNEKLQSEVAGALRNLAGEKEEDKKSAADSPAADAARPASPRSSKNAGRPSAIGRKPSKSGGGVFGGLSRRSSPKKK